MKCSPTLSVAELLAYVMEWLLQALAAWKAAQVSAEESPLAGLPALEAEHCTGGVVGEGSVGAGARQRHAIPEGAMDAVAERGRLATEAAERAPFDEAGEGRSGNAGTWLLDRFAGRDRQAMPSHRLTDSLRLVSEARHDRRFAIFRVGEVAGLGLPNSLRYRNFCHLPIA